VWFYTEGTTSNRNGIGARLKITTESGIQIRDVQSGTGFAFMGSLNTHFGLGEDELIESVEVCWPSGTIDRWEDLAVNTSHLLVEGSAPVNIEDIVENELLIYPNPATDRITIDGMENRAGLLNYVIYDMRGQIVSSASLKNNNIDINELSSGVYVLEIQGKTPVRKQFTKL
jgi:hypothetical protein